jgi:osmoprotectant transport system substrate-binding protein
LLACLSLLALAGCRGAAEPIVIGSKNVTEQAVLGELLAQYLEKRGYSVERRFYLAGTYVCHQALTAGRIDLYVEYTGTALTSILRDPPVLEPRAALERVREEYARRYGLVVMPSLGFDNTFALVIRGADARRLQVRTISEAARFLPSWRTGFGYEFMERKDGFAGLAEAYGLHLGSAPRIMDLGLLYRALDSRQVDLIAGNTTDGLIQALDLQVLQDDRHYFPPYDAIPVVRRQTLDRHPGLGDALQALAGKISAADIRGLNYAVDAEHKDVKSVVSRFLSEKGM